jgi:hypothetical protein
MGRTGGGGGERKNGGAPACADLSTGRSSPSNAPRRRTVAECVDQPSHAGRLDGAARVGAAARDGRVVQVGLFGDGRARFRASACATLIAYAEVACELLERGASPASLDAAALQDRLTGVHPDHLERAALVAAALRAAFQKEEP